MAVSANYDTAHALIGDARLALHALLTPCIGSCRPGPQAGSTARRSWHGHGRPSSRRSSTLAHRASGQFAPNACWQSSIVSCRTTPSSLPTPERRVRMCRRITSSARPAGTSSPTAPTARSAIRWRPRSARGFARRAAGASRSWVTAASASRWANSETVVRCKVPLLMLVLSNATYGWIKASQKASYGERYFSVDFSRTDHARVASAYGVKSWRVEDPDQLGAVLREGRGARRAGAGGHRSCSRWKTRQRRCCSGWVDERPRPAPFTPEGAAPSSVPVATSSRTPAR